MLNRVLLVNTGVPENKEYLISDLPNTSNSDAIGVVKSQ